MPSVLYWPPRALRRLMTAVLRWPPARLQNSATNEAGAEFRNSRNATGSGDHRQHDHNALELFACMTTGFVRLSTGMTTRFAEPSSV
ncbi:hypothetical protein [Kibdelosporangium philippinense]|uniref:hypothetical protein n=1 Tax=Kibdelosporangium philippinense TaxID=211113 RepID=UPI00360A69D4